MNFFTRSDVDIMNEINDRITELKGRGTIIIDDDNPKDDYLGLLFYNQKTDEIRFTTEGL